MARWVGPKSANLANVKHERRFPGVPPLERHGVPQFHGGLNLIQTENFNDFNAEQNICQGLVANGRRRLLFGIKVRQDDVFTALLVRGIVAVLHAIASVKRREAIF